MSEPSDDISHEERGRGRRRRGAAVLLGLAVSALFAWLAFRKVDAGPTWEAIRSVSLPLLATAVLIKGGTLVALAIRSRVTMAAAGRLPLGTLISAHLVGYTGNNVLPFRLGELLRMEYLTQRTPAGRSFTLTTVVVERLLDSLLLVILFAATAPTVLGSRSWGPGVLMVGLGTVAALVLAAIMGRSELLPAAVARVGRLWPVVGRVLEGRARQVVHGLRVLTGPVRLFQAFAATVLYWGIGFSTLTVLIRAFGLEVPWWAPAFILAMVAVGTALPSSPAFVGTFHYFSAWALELLGVAPEAAVSFAIVSHAVAVGPYSLVGLAFFAPWIASWATVVVHREADHGDDARARSGSGDAVDADDRAVAEDDGASATPR